jgi:hypothetical protein
MQLHFSEQNTLLLTFTIKTTSYRTMAALPDINMPYVAPAWRKTDGLPADPSAYIPAARVSHVPPDGAYLRTFFRAVCAILPGDMEATIQRFPQPDSIRAIVEPHMRRYISERFNTADTNNFNCLLKELITHHDFLVDQHNYALQSTLISLFEPEGEIWNEQFYPFHSASCFENPRRDALRRLDILFEARKEEVNVRMEGDLATGEIRRLETIHQKLRQEPEVVTRSYTFVHELPPPKLHFAEMEMETRYVNYTGSHP